MIPNRVEENWENQESIIFQTSKRVNEKIPQFKYQSASKFSKHYDFFFYNKKFLFQCLYYISINNSRTLTKYLNASRKRMDINSSTNKLH